MNKIKSIIPPSKISLLIISVEVVLILFIDLTINEQRLFDINRILISSTGIFAAIVISALMNGFSRLQSEFDKVKEDLIPLAEKLTRFRKLLYYIVASHDVWGDSNETRFLRKLRDWYPNIDANSSQFNIQESDPRFEIVNDDKFETRVSNLYRTILTILDVRRSDEMHFIQRFRHHYTYSQILHIYESFNQIWYYLSHKPANVNMSYDHITRIYRSSFEEELSHFVDDEKIKRFDKDMMSDISNEFYNTHIPHMALLLSKFGSGIPKLYKFLFADLLALIVFGLILPLINNTLSRVCLKTHRTNL